MMLSTESISSCQQRRVLLDIGYSEEDDEEKKLDNSYCDNNYYWDGMELGQQQQHRRHRRNNHTSTSTNKSAVITTTTTTTASTTTSQRRRMMMTTAAPCSLRCNNNNYRSSSRQEEDFSSSFASSTAVTANSSMSSIETETETTANSATTEESSQNNNNNSFSNNNPLLYVGDTRPAEALRYFQTPDSCSKLTATSVPNNNIQFRTIQAKDRDIIQNLHEEWFPVTYHDDFYNELCYHQRMVGSQQPLYTDVAVTVTVVKRTGNDENDNIEVESSEDNECQIVACLVGSFLQATTLSKRVQEMLVPNRQRHSKLFYLMTVGTIPDYRKHGLASIMIQKLEQNVLLANENNNCGCLYLHVLTDNYNAIRMYEKLGFYRVEEIDNYYKMNNDNEGYRNCYLYAKYYHGNRGHRTNMMFLLSSLFTQIFWNNRLIQRVVQVLVVSTTSWFQKLLFLKQKSSK